MAVTVSIVDQMCLLRTLRNYFHRLLLAAAPIFDAIHALGDKPPYQDRVGDDDTDGTDMVLIRAGSTTGCLCDLALCVKTLGIPFDF